MVGPEVEEELNHVMEISEENLQGFESVEAMGNYLELKASNHERFKKLTEQGLRIDPVQVLSLQFDTLMGILGEELTADWAIEFESRMNAVLTNMEAELPRMQLLQGTQGPNAPVDVRKLLQG